ncbi:MAG: T9SS type A sorting domain-containing protein, partial [Nonlabens sp.]
TLGYDTDASRMALYNVTATMINLKTLYPETFNSVNNDLDVSGIVKRINLNGTQFDAVVVANFGITAQNVNPNFSETGTWYDYFDNNTAVNITSTTAMINLQPGEYKLFTTQLLQDPLSNEDSFLTQEFIKLYPNPTASTFKLSQEAQLVQVYNTSGQLTTTFKGVRDIYNVSDLKQGIYFVKITTADQTQVEKLIKM